MEAVTDNGRSGGDMSDGLGGRSGEGSGRINTDDAAIMGGMEPAVKGSGMMSTATFFKLVRTSGILIFPMMSITSLLMPSLSHNAE